VAAKPRSEWSAGYRQRIERGEARGLTRQQARGHFVAGGEHKTRVQREIKRQGLSNDQLRIVRKYGEQRAARDKALNAEDIVSFAKRNGYGAFKRIKDERSSLVRSYRKTSKSGRKIAPIPKADFASSHSGLLHGHGGYGGGYDRGSYPRDYDTDEDMSDEYFADDYGGDFEDLEGEDLPIEWLHYHDS
jgi:hypothetical protein